MITVLPTMPRSLWRLAVRHRYARTANEATAVQKAALLAYGPEQWLEAQEAVQKAAGSAR